jgi:NAD(P)-dependent dehydrogenase (short-subunit alcohol dehydrogenase family)
MRGLKGKNVLVTGGSSGIGQAIAVWFAGYGALDGHTRPQTWILAGQGAAALLVFPWFVRLLVGADHALVGKLLAPIPTTSASPT